jgi:hypothetical protein
MEQHKSEKLYLTAAQLCERYGGVSHMWLERRLANDPAFPRPVRFGNSKLRMFDLAELEAYERMCATKETSDR